MRYSVITLMIMLSSCTLGKQLNCAENDDYEYSSFSIDVSEGFISSSEDAAGIAEIVAKRIYGDENVEKQKPFIVSLKNDIWYVRGTLSGSQYTKGGVLEMEISKSDGKIIRISHGK